MGDAHNITIITPEDERLSSKVFYFLNQRNYELVKSICSKLPDGALHSCTIHNSTVLHLACYFEFYDLADHLFDKLSEEQYNSLPSKQNNWGSTVLHDAANSNKGCEFVKKMLHKVPDLLQALNKAGESAVFAAIPNGSSVNNSMYSFLATKVKMHSGNPLRLLQRRDKKTILHIAVQTRRFEIAVDIAQKFPELCNLSDDDEKTALQMLALSPTAFLSGATLDSLEKIVYSILIVPNEEQGTRGEVSILRKAINFILCSRCCICPMIEDVKKMKKIHNDALKLAEILIKKDTSWVNTHKPLRLVGDDPRNGGDVAETEPPLFLATRVRCNEIVEKILDKFPQAVDYINSNRENLLHVAIRSLNIHVFNFVLKKKLSNKGLFSAVDKNENCMLHMVGLRPATLKKVTEDTTTKGPFSGSQPPVSVGDESPVDKKLVTPVQQLSSDLMLLEELEKRCPDYMKNHRNKENLTARELLAREREKLRIEAKEYMKTTAEQCTVVIVLIATVAFAAAYTVPGGPDQKTGHPVLLGDPLFLVFTVTDVLSLGLALTAVIVFLTIFTSPFQLKDFQRSLPQKLLLGFTLLFLSVTCMMISFAATIILTVKSQHQWPKIALYIVSFFPVLVFMLSYIPYYNELLQTLTHSFMKMGRYLPRTSACVPKPIEYSPLKKVRN